MVLNIDSISKSYGSVKAVSQLSLNIEQGTVYGILGPNGSGKSTTLGIVLGTVNADSGTYSWFNSGNHAHQRRRIGTLLEKPNFYPYLNSIQNLKITAEIKKTSFKNIEPVLESVGLLQRAKSQIRTFSLGMHQRLAVANALLAEPEVLVLDEPTNGLDPQGIADMRELILRVASEGTTIIMASHILDEVEKTCSHVAILKQGNLLAAGPVGSIIGGGERIVIKAENEDLLKTLLRSTSMVDRLIERPKQLIAVLVDEPGATSRSLNKYLHESGLAVDEIYSEKSSLEAQFLELTQG